MGVLFTFKEVSLMDVLLTPSRIRRLFLRTIDAMEKHPDDFVLHPGRDFTRHRRLPLKDLILLMIVHGDKLDRR